MDPQFIVYQVSTERQKAVKIDDWFLDLTLAEVVWDCLLVGKRALGIPDYSEGDGKRNKVNV